MFEKLEQKLIADWRDAWKFLSVRVNVLFAAVISTYMLLPESQQIALLSMLPFVGPKAAGLIVVIGFVLSTAARVKAQPALEKKAP